MHLSHHWLPSLENVPAGQALQASKLTVCKSPWHTAHRHASFNVFHLLLSITVGEM